MMWFVLYSDMCYSDICVCFVCKCKKCVMWLSDSKNCCVRHKSTDDRSSEERCLSKTLSFQKHSDSIRYYFRFFSRITCTPRLQELKHRFHTTTRNLFTKSIKHNIQIFHNTKNKSQTPKHKYQQNILPPKTTTRGRTICSTFVYYYFHSTL